jgi:antitoxin VapB
MTFHITNPKTDALARRVAEVKGVDLTEAVHIALEHELQREAGTQTLRERSMEFARRLREKSRPELRNPVDKEFIDNLYERD